jgi:uncharacterized protein (UPF0332 family)
MSFDWSKFLELAKYLANNSENLSNEEACFRSAVSRAYYAAFCITRKYIQKTDGKEIRGGDAHKKVREHLQKSGNKIKKKVANQLEAIHFNRKKADYDDKIDRETPRSLAFKTLKFAETIMNEIKELSNQG